jgi:hypothetical protein
MISTRDITQRSLADILDRVLEQAIKGEATSFRDLVKTAGLDPTCDFIGAFLQGMDFRDEDLSGFDFSHADLAGADFRRANVDDTRFDGAELKGAIGLPESVQPAAQNPPQPPSDFNLAEAHRMILMGRAPPESWRPFISELNFLGEALKQLDSLAGLSNLRTLILSLTGVIDLSALANLKRLHSLYLSHTSVSDISPLASLNNLEYLDLSFTRVRDVSALSGLNRLQNVYVFGAPILDLSPLGTLTNLKDSDVREALRGPS